MSRRLSRPTNDEALIPIQVKVPGWLRSRAIEEAGAEGKTLSEWIRDLIREKTGARAPEKKQNGKGGSGR